VTSVLSDFGKEKGLNENLEERNEKIPTIIMLSVLNVFSLKIEGIAVFQEQHSLQHVLQL
jgi:hypothetical protein